VRNATDRSNTGGFEPPRTRAPRARTSATAPSPGEQNMNCVSGLLTIFDPSTSSSDSGRRRHAFSFSDPLRNAFDATFASVELLMPCSAM
jgi:hypothetical protein